MNSRDRFYVWCMVSVQHLQVSVVLFFNFWPLDKKIYISKNQFTFLCVCVSVSVCLCAVRLKRGIRTVEAKNMKKISKKCAFADHWRPLFGPTRTAAREHGNPLRPVQTRHNVDKNLANAIVARFRRISSALRGRFPLIPSISGESAVTRHDQYHQHRILCSLA